MNPVKLLIRSNISIEFKAGEICLSNYYAYDLDSFRYISHHGIKGQKWGIRRFQNKDGSWTDQGKRRYSTGTYKRELNKLDTQVSKQIYKREKVIGKDDRLTKKAMKLQEKADSKEKKISKEKANKLLNKHLKYEEMILKSEKLIKEGEALTNKTIASAINQGYSINSKKVDRLVSNGRKVYAGLCGFSGGMLIGVPVAVLGTSAYNAIKSSHGYSKIASTGVVEGNKFKVKKTKNGQIPSFNMEQSRKY